VRVMVDGKRRGDLWVRMPGVHYAENALGALCVADVFGVSFQDSGEALAAFGGVDRRFTVRGEAAGVLVIDDYGHHPTEIAATIAAARLYGRRVVVAFQPHRYSRTRDLLSEFAPALAGADELLLTDIYGAGESAIAGVTIERLVETFSSGGVRYVPRRALCEDLATCLRAGDLLLTLGAGDITQVSSEILARLAAAA
jgi:UDP-N-acetylmuramate--alanine ligase